MSEVELLRGIEVPKVSPKRLHGRLQLIVGEMLISWAGDTGEVASEWRFRLQSEPTDEATSLVPDLAFVRQERLAALSDDDVEEPPFAPDVAIEIRSAGDRERNIQTKVALYLDAGARLVLDVDPFAKQIIAHDSEGKRVFDNEATFEHTELPGFTFLVAALFERATFRRTDSSAP